MARHPALSLHCDENNQSSSLRSPDTVSTTITLVKPVLSTPNAQRILPQLSARPKFGLLPSQASESAQPEEAPSSMALFADDDKEASSPMHNIHLADAWDMKSANSWDYKFAASLVALLIVVNTGLVMVLHRDKGTQSVVEVSAPVMVTTPVTKIASGLTPLDATSAATAVLPAPVKQAHVQPPVAPAIPVAATQDLLAIITKE